MSKNEPQNQKNDEKGGSMKHTNEIDITFSADFIRDLEKMLEFCIENDTNSVEIEFGPVVDGVRFCANVDFYGQKVTDESCDEISIVQEEEIAKKLCNAIIRSEGEMVKKEDYEKEEDH